jgi:hypothetical protein
MCSKGKVGTIDCRCEDRKAVGTLRAGIGVILERSWLPLLELPIHHPENEYPGDIFENFDFNSRIFNCQNLNKVSFVFLKYMPPIAFWHQEAHSGKGFFITCHFLINLFHCWRMKQIWVWTCPTFREHHKITILTTIVHGEYQKTELLLKRVLWYWGGGSFTIKWYTG